MKQHNIENVIGAMSLMLADELLRASETKVPQNGLAVAAIVLLEQESGIRIERLRRSLQLSHPGAVRLVDRLESGGLVIRKTHAEDRRAIALHLTVRGRRSAKAILNARQKSLSHGLSALTLEERKKLGQLASKLLRAMVRDEDHAYSVCRLCDADVCEDCPVEDELIQRSVAI